MTGIFEMMGLSALPPRFRSSDPSTSRKAAKNATGSRAEAQRIAIRYALATGGPMTAKALAEATGLDYYTIQRRISEVQGIERTNIEFEGCLVWRYKE